MCDFYQNVQFTRVHPHLSHLRCTLKSQGSIILVNFQKKIYFFATNFLKKVVLNRESFGIISNYAISNIYFFKNRLSLLGLVKISCFLHFFLIGNLLGKNWRGRLIIILLTRHIFLTVNFDRRLRVIKVVKKSSIFYISFFFKNF